MQDTAPGVDHEVRIGRPVTPVLERMEGIAVPRSLGDEAHRAVERRSFVIEAVVAPVSEP